MARIINIPLLCLGWFLYIFALLVPKRPGLWIFGSWFGLKYADNTRYFFEFCQSKSDLELIWITKNKRLARDLRGRGISAHYYLSPRGIFSQLRSEVAYVTQSVRADLLAPAIGGSTTVVQLWHGLSLKKVMYDVPVLHNNRRRITGFLLPFFKHRQDFLIASSDETADVLSQAFRVHRDRLLQVGQPRNMVFLDSNERSKTFRAIYMPTLRGGAGDEVDLFSPYGFDVDKLEREFDANNIELTIRVHPVNQPTSGLKKKLNAAKRIKLSTASDIYDEINTYDFLITDYSSIYIDFLLTGRPIIFAPFDRTEFNQHERGFYYRYEDVTLEPYCGNWEEVCDRLIELVGNPGVTWNTKKYNDLTAFFHGSTGCDASIRLYEHLRGLGFGNR